MATVTRNIGLLVDGEDQAIAQVDYDDALLRLTAFRMINNTAIPVVGTVIRDSNGRIYSTTFPARRTTFISIPTNGAQDRIDVVINSNGRINGVNYSFYFAPTP